MSRLLPKTEALKDQYNPWYPKYDYRLGQKAVVTSAWSAIHNGYKFIALNLPTGWGKSVLGGALGNLAQGSHICTTQIKLQDQYLAFGEQYKRTVGRSNFVCMNNPKATCDRGECLTRDNYNCPYRPGKEGKFHAYLDKYWDYEDKRCPYWAQVAEGVNAKHRIFNYAYYILKMRSFGNEFDTRYIQIMDEGHKVEEYVRGVASFEMKNMSLYHVRYLAGVDTREYYEFDMIPVRRLDTIEKTVDWLKTLKNIVEIRLQDTQTAKAGGVTGLMRRLQMLERFRDKIENFLEWYKRNPKNWVRYDIKDGIKLVPLYVGDYAHETLFKYARVNIFMSATLPPKTVLCKRLGIGADDLFYYDGTSIFPPENAPIYVQPSPVMKYDPSGMGPVRDKMGGSILATLRQYKGKRGLILCNSFAEVEHYTEYIRTKDVEQYMRLTVHQRGDKADYFMEEHIRKHDSVFISPSSWEGLDLKGDLGEFLFITKIPYDDFSDPVIQGWKEIDKGRFFEDACLKLRQGLGRVIRDPEDKADIIIGDAAFKTLYRYNRDQFPEDIQKRVQYL